MKTIQLGGFDASVNEASLRYWMECLDTVHRVAIIREVIAGAPLGLIEMKIREPVVAHVTSRITRHWRQGSRISVRRLVY